ncbi:MAG TPA: hypothetical protein VGP07_03940 [Polyangia bacterium]|jgi:hypothetical protein
MVTLSTFSSAILARKKLMLVVTPNKAGTALEHFAAQQPRIFTASATKKDTEPVFRAGIVDALSEPGRHGSGRNSRFRARTCYSAAPSS